MISSIVGKTMRGEKERRPILRTSAEGASQSLSSTAETHESFWSWSLYHLPEGALLIPLFRESPGLGRSKREATRPYRCQRPPSLLRGEPRGQKKRKGARRLHPKARTLLLCQLGNKRQRKKEDKPDQLRSRQKTPLLCGKMENSKGGGSKKGKKGRTRSLCTP